MHYDKVGGCQMISEKKANHQSNFYIFGITIVKIWMSMNLSPIKTEKDYQKALKRLDEIFDAKKGSPEGDELEILGILIEKYEDEKFPIGLPDPIEAIKFRMEQMGMKNKDLAEIVGFRSRVSEILNRKRKLTLDMIRKIHTVMNIPTEVLIQAY